MSEEVNQADQGQQPSNQQSRLRQGQPAQQNAICQGTLTATNVGRLQHELESLQGAGSQALQEGTPPPGYSAPARPTNAPRPVNRPPPLLPLNNGGTTVPSINYFPQPQTNDGSSSEEDEPVSRRNGTFSVTINSGIQVQGHGSMVGVEPTNAAILTTDVVRMLGDQGLFNRQQQQGENSNPANQFRRPRHFQIKVNSGVSVVGNNNIVGGNLEDVVKYRRPTPQPTPVSSRQVSSTLPGPNPSSTPSAPGSRQWSGTLPGQTQPQGTQEQGGGTTGKTLEGATVPDHNSDLYDEPQKPGRVT